MLGYRARVKKKDFTLSGEVDSAEWVPFEHALEKLRGREHCLAAGEKRD